MAQYDGQIVFGVKIDEKEAQTGLQRVENMIKVGVAALSAKKLAEIAKMGVDYNAQMEQFQASFETMLGDAQKASEHISQLKKMAAKTPFEMTDLAQASQTLQAFGVDAKEVEPTLKMLGDISLGNKERFNGLALVFGQVKSQGKLMGQDLLQMINQGFNPLQIISEKTGESMASLKDRMSKGQISFEEVAKAMEIATSAGGKFYGGLEKQSQTLNGQISTMKDNLKSLLGQITQPIFQKIKSDFLPAINNGIEYIRKNSDKLIGTTKILATTLISIKTLKMSAHMVTAAKSMTLFKLATTQVGVATKVATVSTYAFKAATTALGGPIGLVIAAVGGLIAISTLWGKESTSASDKVLKKNKEVVSSHQELQKSYKERVTEIKKAASESADEVLHLEALRGELDRIVDSNGKVIAGYEERARVIVDELSNATGIQMEIVDGEIKGYKELGKQIDDYILKKKAEIAIKSAEEEYTAAIENRKKEIESYEQLKKQYDEVTNKLKELKDLQGQKHEYGRAQSINKWAKEEEKLRKELEKSAEAVKNASNVEQAYTQMYSDFAQGEYAEVSNSMMEFRTTQAQVADANKDKLEKMKTDAENQLTALKDLYAKTGDENVKVAMDNKEKELGIVRDKLDSIIIETNNKSPFYSEAIRQMNMGASEQFAADLQKWKETGGNKVAMATSGVEQNTEGLTGRIRYAATKALEAFNENQNGWSAAGGSIVSGIHRGIDNKEDALFSRLRSLASRALSAAQSALGINSPSKLFRDRVGVSIPEGIGVGIEKGGYIVTSSIRRVIDKAIEAGETQKNKLNSLWQDVTNINNSMNRRGFGRGVINIKPYQAAGELTDRGKIEVKQEIHIHQPVQTPGETAKALRREAVKLGLAGGAI